MTFVDDNLTPRKNILAVNADYIKHGLKKDLHELVDMMIERLQQTGMDLDNHNQKNLVFNLFLQLTDEETMDQRSLIRGAKLLKDDPVNIFTACRAAMFEDAIKVIKIGDKVPK